MNKITIALYTVGADDIFKNNMIRFVNECSCIPETYNAEPRLIKDAQSRRFPVVLAFAIEALSSKAIAEIEKTGCKIYSYKNREVLRKTLERHILDMLKRDQEIAKKEAEFDKRNALGIDKLNI